MPDHECLDHLEEKRTSGVERHGLDCGPYEHWSETWLVCTICGDRFTEKEVDEIAKKEGREVFF